MSDGVVRKPTEHDKVLEDLEWEAKISDTGRDKLVSFVKNLTDVTVGKFGLVDNLELTKDEALLAGAGGTAEKLK